MNRTDGRDSADGLSSRKFDDQLGIQVVYHISFFGKKRKKQKERTSMGTKFRRAAVSRELDAIYVT